MTWEGQGIREPSVALEPVTHANDGFNLSDAGVASTGVFLLEPGQERGGTFSLTLESL